MTPAHAADVSSDFLRAIVSRGYLHQCSDVAGLDAAAAKGVRAYVGYDLTAPSLHIGNLVSIMMLRRLQQTGGKPIVLLGGATTKVGDPSGKDESRKLMTPETIAANMASIRGAFEKFLSFGDGETDAVFVNNDDWLSDFGYIEFLRTFGTHFTINRMLSFDSVKLRLDREQPLTFLEFNYMLMQAVDFRELHKRFGVRLQMGGSDQWGNIINGVELTRRMDAGDVYGLTAPLVTTAAGAKMGKTADGAVWLNPDMLSPYSYWQFWRNCEDADVGRFLRLFTDAPLDEIARLETLRGAEINDAKKTLATLATAMLHGEAASQEAQATATATFAGGGAGAALPTITVSLARLANLRVIDALRETGLVESNGEAKRHIKAGAVSMNNHPITDEAATLGAADMHDKAVKLSVGKKKHALVRVED